MIDDLCVRSLKIDYLCNKVIVNSNCSRISWKILLNSLFEEGEEEEEVYDGCFNITIGNGDNGLDDDVTLPTPLPIELLPRLLLRFFNGDAVLEEDLV